MGRTFFSVSLPGGPLGGAVGYGRIAMRSLYARQLAPRIVQRDRMQQVESLTQPTDVPS